MIREMVSAEAGLARARSIREWGAFLRSELEILDDAVSAIMRAGAVGMEQERAMAVRRGLNEAWDHAAALEQGE